MATGYTFGVAEGKITTLEDFAMDCARAFGALIDLRDSPRDAEVPEDFTPSGAYQDRLDDAKRKLAEAETRTEAEWRIASADAYLRSMAHWRNMNTKNAETRARYEKMLEKVIGWQPPIRDHILLKEFMVTQLSESIRWDSTTYEEPEQLFWRTFMQDQIRYSRDEVSRAERDLREEIARAKGKTDWVQALRNSFAPDQHKEGETPLADLVPDSPPV